MEFKTLLRLISSTPTCFDAEKAAQIVAANAISGYGQNFDILLKSATIKNISNDLGRLYKMGFLLRRRIKRRIMTGRGPTFRGYKYVYRISKQGRQYLRFLDSPPDRLSKAIYRPKRFEDQLGLELLRQKLPPNEKLYAEEMHRALFDNYLPIGRYKRFPRKKADTGLVVLIKYYRDRLTEEEEKNRLLREQVQLLREKTNRSGEG